MHLGDLERDLQQKLEADRKQIEAWQSAELEKLRQNLQKESSRVLNTIKADTELLRQRITSQWKWFLLLPFVTIMSLLIGSSLGSWVMMRSLTNLSQEIQTQKKTLEILKNQTWEIELYQTSNGKFIILPPDSPYQTDWKCNGKPCLKL